MEGLTGPERGLGSREYAGLSALAAAIAVVSVATFLQQGEDSYISYRYVRQLVAGNGLVYNAGEYVEGYSNLLWVLLLAPFAWLGLPLGPCGQALATASLIALAVGGFIWARRFLSGAFVGAQGLAWWLAGAFALDPLLHYHDDRGLETVSYSVALCGALLVVGSRGKAWLAGILAGTAVFLRPEGILFAGVIAGGIVFGMDPLGRRREEFRRMSINLLIYLSIPIGFFLLQLLFRRYYYGEWVPNTVIAKRHSGTGGHWQLLAYSMTRMGLPLVALAGFVWALWEPRWRALAVAGLGVHLAAAVFQLRAGGLLNEGFRYLAPLFPLTAVGCWLVVLQARNLGSNLILGRAMVRSLGAVLLLLQPVLLFQAPTAGERWLLQGNGNAPRSRLVNRLFELETWNLPERLRWYVSDPVFINADVGRFLRVGTQPGETIAADQMGQLGYFVGIDRPVVDLLGLMDRRVAREGLSVEYLLERAPSLVVVEACLDTEYWPQDRRGRAHVAGLLPILDDPRFLDVYAPKWMLRPKLEDSQLGFLVYARRSELNGAGLAEIEIGADGETIRRVWRVF